VDGLAAGIEKMRRAGLPDAAIEAFRRQYDARNGAGALRVPRRCFAPVKTTNDLLVVRSDAYVLRESVYVEPARSAASARHSSTSTRASASCYPSSSFASRTDRLR
jgi:hypothetical protein